MTQPDNQPDAGDAPERGRVVTVQLPSGPAAHRQFLRRLQFALGDDATLGSLPPGPGPDVFLIPGTAERMLRERNDIAPRDDQSFSMLLADMGALLVHALDAPAYTAAAYRGTVAEPGPAGPAAKLSVAPVPDPHRLPRAEAALLPRLFRGPYDWNLGPRGANVVAAWQMFAGAPAHAEALPWKDIRIGHLDTGYTEHAALGWDHGQSATVDANQGSNYWPPEGPDARDPGIPGSPGHGTRTSAAFAGYRPGAPGHPFYGVAPGVQVVPYRVTDSVLVDHVPGLVAAALHEAIDDGCHIVNIALGALRGDARVARALDRAYDSGVIVCCAAGQVWPWVVYPGRFNRCVTVGGVGPDFKPWAGAATGRHVDLCAPADMIRRVHVQFLPPGQAGQDIARKADGDGTSYATAACAGAAALWLAWHGVAALHAHYGGDALWKIPAAFKHLARATATPGAWPAGSDRHGSGVLDAAALLKAPLPAQLHQARAADGPFDPDD